MFPPTTCKDSLFSTSLPALISSLAHDNLSKVMAHYVSLHLSDDCDAGVCLLTQAFMAINFLLIKYKDFHFKEKDELLC